MKKYVFTLAEGATHVDMPNNVRQVAFTLAEVLITLGIIGIVAALTLPTLIGNYKKKQAVTQLKKAYSVLEQTIKMAEKDFGPINDWDEWNNAETILDKYFKPYLNGSVVYPTNSDVTKLMCYDSSSKNHGNGAQYNWLDGIHISSPFIANKTASIKLSNGTCIGLMDTPNVAAYAKLFTIDINGSQSKPNIAGKDLFWFNVDQQGFMKPKGYDMLTEDIISTQKNACNLKAYLGGYVCAARIMNEGWEINYWNN